MTRRILKVYYDKPSYVVPKDIQKIFTLHQLFLDLQTDFRNSTSKADKMKIEIEQEENKNDLLMMLKLVTPKDANWSMDIHTVDKDKFCVLTITEEIHDSNCIQ